jgi:poly-beta-1,6-N-acetyl-D-glucosamine synthase
VSNAADTASATPTRAVPGLEFAVHKLHSMAPVPTYVLITPARNESQLIELTIKSVVAQTVRPLKWIIVSDGSTDGTDDILREYAADHSWIELVRMPERKERDFAGKVYAFNAGYKVLAGLDYDVIASLDADVSFEKDYFSFLLTRLAEDHRLGLVGTPFKEGSNPTYDYRFVNIEHVSGACQVFRRQCFEEIGGYVPVKGGCIDHIAVLSARMKGWKTRTFTDKVCLHHRKMGTAQHGLLMARFRNGLKDYSIGNHPLWELSRTAYQMTKKPYVIGGLALLSGYVWSLARRLDRPVCADLVVFQRKEQMQRLREFFAGKQLLERKTS